MDRTAPDAFPAKLEEGLKGIGVWLFGVWLFGVVGLEKENCCPSWIELRSLGVFARLFSLWLAIVDLSGFCKSGTPAMKRSPSFPTDGAN